MSLAPSPFHHYYLRTKHSCLSYGPGIPFYGKQNHVTLFGISMTYIQIIMTSLAFFYFGKELIVKENPNLIITENRLPIDTSYELNFGNEDFLLNFGIYDHDRYVPIEKSYFRIFGEHKIYIPSSTPGVYAIKSTFFELENCSLDYVRKGYGYDKTENEIKYMSSVSYCFTKIVTSMKKSENYPKEKANETHLAIRGFFGSQQFSSINVKYAKCVNNTDSGQPACKSPEEIDEKLKFIYLGGKVLNNYLKPRSYHNPINIDTEWFYTKASTTSVKQLNLKLQRNVLISDSGLFLTIEEPTVFFSLSSTSEVEATKEKGDEDYFFCVNLNLDKVERVFSRKYKKLEDVFAQVGGVLKTSLLLFALIIKPIATFQFKTEILRKVFEDRKNKCGGQNKKLNFQKRKTVFKAFDEFEKLIDLKNIIRYMFYTKRLLKSLLPPDKRKPFKRRCELDFKRDIFNKEEMKGYDLELDEFTPEKKDPANQKLKNQTVLNQNKLEEVKIFKSLPEIEDDVVDFKVKEGIIIRKPQHQVADNK